MIHRLFLLLCLAAFSGSHAQEQTVQPTPFTVLLDFNALRQPAAPKPSLPIWLESVNFVPSLPDAASTTGTETAPASAGLPEPAPAAPHTTVRIRLRAMPGLNDTLLLRLFFNDNANARPSVTGWSETGTQTYASGELGAGLDLTVSETLTIRTENVAYLDIDIPGDGSNLRKALLTTLKKSTVNQSLDLASTTGTDATPLVDPFGNPEPQPAPANDITLFGRVRATLEGGFIRLAAPPVTNTDASANKTDSLPTSATYEFELESAPLLALITFDILNADPLAPVQAWINDTPLGAAALQQPDLADPAYIGVVRPLQAMRFHYAGWLHGQIVLPGSALKTGTNTLTLQLPQGASPVAIRAIELQLKHNWRILDYQFAP